jgi:hypothetical protein
MHTQEPRAKNKRTQELAPRTRPHTMPVAPHIFSAFCFLAPDRTPRKPKKELRTQGRTRHTQELRTKNETPRTCPENSPAHLAPHTFSGAREGVLVAVAAVRTRRRLARTSERVRGAGTGLEPSLGYGRSRIPAMASSQGDVRPSPMAYPAVRPLPKLPLLARQDTGPTS